MTNLMQFLRDKIFDRIIALKKGKITSKMSALRTRHKKSLLLNQSDIHKNGEDWIVKSQDNSGEHYALMKSKDCTKNCPLMCQICEHCLHNFRCTCIDNCVQYNMCKHIHLLCMMLKDPQEDKNNPSYSLEEDGNLIIDENDKLNLIELEKGAHLETIRNKQKKSNRKEELLKLYNDFGKSIEQADDDSEDIEELLKIMKKAKNSYKVYKDSKLHKKNSFKMIKNVPSNKKIAPQRFCTTKKQSVSKKGKNLLKPTKEEINKITTGLVLKHKEDTHTNQEEIV